MRTHRRLEEGPHGPGTRPVSDRNAAAGGPATRVMARSPWSGTEVGFTQNADEDVLVVAEHRARVQSATACRERAHTRLEHERTSKHHPSRLQSPVTYAVLTHRWNAWTVFVTKVPGVPS